MDVSPAYWGISQEDLDFFRNEVRNLWAEGSIADNPASPNPFHNDERIGPNIYQVNESYIKPTTLEAGGVSWALMRNPCGLKCDVFASHAWQEGVFEFIWKVSMNWPRHTRGLYCCFLANPQNSDIGSLLGDDPLHSPFARALEVCSHVLIVPNRRVSIYSRLWCVFEADLAMHRSLQIVMPKWPTPRSVILRMLPYLVVSGLACLLFMYLGGHFGGHLVFQPTVPLTPCHLQGFFVFLFAPIGFRVPTIYIGCLCFAVGWQLAYWITHDSTCPKMRVLDDYVEPIFLTLTSVECVIKHLFAKALSDEGLQLKSDTVQNASCSNEEDDNAIRKIISGRESAIDHMITLLKQVGRYDDVVALNLKRGLHPIRVRDGVMHMRGVGGCCLWVGEVVRTIAAAVNGSVAVITIEVGIAARLLCCAAMLCSTVWWGAEATYFVDTLLWSSLIAHFLNEFLALVVYKQYSYSVFMSGHDQLESLGYASVLVCVGVVAVSNCICFYRQPSGSCIPELTRKRQQAPQVNL